MEKPVTYLTRGAVIAALYAVLTVALAPLSYGIVQVRVSEALTALAYFEPSAIPGLFIGCLIANIYGGNGPWDIIGGSLITLVAAYLTWKIRRPALALLPPVVLNGLGVAAILIYAVRVPEAARYSFPIAALLIGLGEGIAVYALGYPLLKLSLLKSGFFVREEILKTKLKA
ncbi:MAG: QueT transporter family protein [Actinobacteria bacterium]|nr:QueT transporter family protein [Actinomycetota bacterium]